MAKQIPGLGRVAGPDQTAKRLLPELLEHLKDEESRVREAAAVSLCEMPDLVPATIRDTRVFPAIREVFHTAAATCPPSTSSSSSTRRALGHGPGKDAYYVPVVHKPSANSQAKNDDKHRTRKLAEALGPMSLRVADTIDPTTAAAVPPTRRWSPRRRSCARRIPIWRSARTRSRVRSRPSWRRPRNPPGSWSWAPARPRTARWAGMR